MCVLMFVGRQGVGGEEGGAHHFALFFAVDEVVVVLHGDEFVPAVAVGDVLQGLELPGGHLQELAIL